MPNFIGGLPAEGSPLNSAEIRNNFIALDARTGKITPRATVPASTNITVDGGTVYFSDRISATLTSQKIELGDTNTGVSAFSEVGFFRDIAIVVRASFNATTQKYEATTVFVEGPQKSSSVSDPTLVPIRSSDLPVARFVVRHNGINTTDKGQIEPIGQSDILDFRSYLDVGGTQYYSATVGDRLVGVDAYGVLVTDAYGAPVIAGETIGTFVGNIKDSFGALVNPIQQAINSLEETGGTIMIRRGLYQIFETINVPDNIQLVGEGYSTVVEMLDTFSGPLFNVTGKKVVFSNLTIRGPSSSVIASEALIRFTGTTGCTVKDCYIERGIVGVEYDSSSRNILISSFLFENSTAVSYIGSTNNILNSNQFTNNTTDYDFPSGNQVVGNILS